MDARWLEHEAAFFSFSSEVEETTREGGNSGGGGNSNCPIYRYATQRAERAQLNENVKTRAEKRKIENREGDQAKQRLDLVKGVLWGWCLRAWVSWIREK